MKQLIFAITGQTGAGKSTVSKIFEKLGVNVIDADAVYHTLIKPEMPCTNEIAKEFGQGVLTSDGAIDRKKLGAIVFKDEEKLQKLNQITHKYIHEKISELTITSPVCAIDGAVIIGSPIQELCKYIVCVCADEKTRKDRIIARDNLTQQAATTRIAAQKGEEFFVENSDFIIYNNDNDLEKQAKKVLSQMLYKEEI